ncbi:hypothetical protein ACFP81_02470 [Deinococcus lacus]|uniref:DUF302 domain-containing protein n=1 Tax=Deinococcus lacus TaxID=392561 RepID=A0ABW1YCQ4_9DEIO
MKRLTLAALALSTVSASALAQAPAASWAANATYVIMTPRIEGNTNLVSGGDLQTVLAAMQRDSAGAIKRRFPAATISETAGPNVVKVTPTLVAPSALVPWAKVSARLDFDLPSGQRVSVSDTYSVIALYEHRADAANFLFDQLMKRVR